MIQWKQRLYAFLLRRVLGPFLDDSKQLHDSIEFSLQEGKFILKDVRLNAAYVSSILGQEGKTTAPIHIRKATIERLEITLTLRENFHNNNHTTDDNNNNNNKNNNNHSTTTTTTPASNSSFAWRAMKLGTTNADLPAVSLLADIQVHGVTLELEPGRRCQAQPQLQQRQPSTVSSEAEPRSVIGSYVDAALASLQLSLKLTKIHVTLYHKDDGDDLAATTTNNNSIDTPKQQQETWMAIKLSSISYKDLDVTAMNNNNISSDYRTILNKSIEILELSIQVGRQEFSQDDDSTNNMITTTQMSPPSTVALAQGAGQIHMRVMETIPPQQEGDPTSSGSDSGCHRRQLQQDIEVNLRHQFNLSVDQVSLVQLHSLATAFIHPPAMMDQDDDNGEGGDAAMTSALSSNPLFVAASQEDSDQEDLKALTGIMKQYREAYHLAEHNQLRGGILVPSNAFEDDNRHEHDDFSEDSRSQSNGGGECCYYDDTTFDVFFDANDQSFYNAASVLAESVGLPARNANGKTNGAAEKSMEDKDHVQTKVRLRLLNGCLKLIFKDPNQSNKTTSALASRVYRPEEYLLLTMSDLNVIMSSTHNSSDMTLNIAHLEIEDAQLNNNNIIDGRGASVEIGSLLNFVEEDAGDEYENDMVVSQAPCLSLHLKNTKDGSNSLMSMVECDVTLQPIELSVQQRTLSNLATFAANVKDEFQTLEPESSPSPVIRVDETGEEEAIKQVLLSCSCPSITVSIPLIQPVVTQPLFSRYGETLNNAPIAGPSLGILLEGVDMAWAKQAVNATDDTLEGSGRFQCHRILFFACAPIGDTVTVDAQMQRTDLFLITGRMEVNPYVPLSIEFKENIPKSKDRNHGRDSFPLVPAISSFKARQEDEDEEIEIDRLLFSRLADVDADSRNDLRGSDPQYGMIAESERCNFVIALKIPEIIVDLTKAEIETLQAMVQAAIPTPLADNSPPENQAAAQERSKTETVMCIATTIDKLTVSLKEDFCVEDLYGSTGSKDRFSVLFALDNFKTHTLLRGSTLRHFRLVSHEPCLYAALHPRIDAEIQRSERGVNERAKLLKQRIRSYKGADLFPILYRSHLFTPISQDTPSLLLDYIDSSVDPGHGFTQKSVHVTLYHLTYRYDPDSEWIERLSNLLPKKDSSTSKDVVKDSVSTETRGCREPNSMTRVFFSVADCSLDFSSPTYFEMTSRSIVRIGDFRLSSNLMEPPAAVQAFSVSLGDVSYHVCNARHSYTPENMKLCRARLLFQSPNVLKSRHHSSVTGSAAEALLRDMGFVEVLSLDSMDAIVAISASDSSRKNPAKNPKVRTSLTFGMLSISGCKDSFGCFTGTLGELNAKLTALTEKDIDAMRQQSYTSTRHERPTEEPWPQGNQTTEKIHSASPLHLNVDEMIPQTIPTLSPKGRSSGDAFLLDGYEWTSINRNPLPEARIPDGEEQIAIWYGPNFDKNQIGDPMTTSPCFPGRIIHQHFPLHAMNDPLSDGDMGASRHAGRRAELSLKSRLLVHKLTVKIRLHDGFDWPDKLTEEQVGKLNKKGLFAIEPLPPKRPEEQDPTSEQMFDEVQGAIGSNVESMQRKTKLMAGLLDEDLNEEKKSNTFEAMPLPEERAANIQRQNIIRRLCRRSHIFFQISASGITVRLDAYERAESHRLASILSVSVSDLFLAETASKTAPVKMLGEWINDYEHPRDSRDGTLMIKMVTWNPESKINEENEVESDDCDVTLQLLPMRCIIDQRAISFVRAFFHSDEEEKPVGGHEKWSANLHLLPPPRFLNFRVKPWKLKVDYNPKKLNVAALREGSLVELVNLSPIDGMVITLSEVCVENVVGMGPVGSGLLSSWVQEICASQLHKFLANARPFEPFTDVGRGISDLVVLPYEAFRNGEDVQRAMSSGFSSLSKTVAFQTLTTTSRLTEYAANQMACMVSGMKQSSNNNSNNHMAAHPLPARPLSAPRGVKDVTGHAVESLARGFQAANYKVVIVPFREYSRNGATGVVTSVIRGIPVLLVAPLTGATEALSYTLLGARNALRPDIRREEEASRTGFNDYDV